MTAFSSDIRSLMPKLDLSRRDMVAASVAAGFALAVSPVSAQTMITTDAEGLEAGDVKVPAGDIQMDAYRAMPASGGPFPVVLVAQEIFGVHEHIRDVCRRFGKLGYLAIAPQLYQRQGDVSGIKDIPEIVSKVVSRVPDAQVMSDLDATVTFAKGGKGDTGRLGITGFCWGGRIVWLYAAHNPNLKAGVAWYGKLVGDKSDLTPTHAVDLAEDLKAPVLGLYGGKDQGIPPETIEQMRAVCQAANKPCEIVVYADAPHGFHADYRPSYRAEPAQDGWSRLRAWFKQYGVA